jgi:hypothetical protein
MPVHFPLIFKGKGDLGAHFLHNAPQATQNLHYGSWRGCGKTVRLWKDCGDCEETVDTHFLWKTVDIQETVETVDTHFLSTFCGKLLGLQGIVDRRSWRSWTPIFLPFSPYFLPSN